MLYHDFSWKGELASEYGIVVQTQAQYIRPRQRTESIVIPGRSGTLTMAEGDLPVWDSIVHSPVCYLRPGFSAEEAGAWLSGRGRVVFGSMQSRSYEAQIINQIPFARIDEAGGYQTFSPIFDCQPGGYEVIPTSDLVLTGPGFITNPGSMHAEPRILISCAQPEDLQLTIGTSLMIISPPEGAAGAWSLVIDSGLEDCFDASLGELRNHWMGGEFPRLLPGLNIVNWVGNHVSMLKITPRWRWL